ncbi:DUF3127 domain-containing protein [Capnocytophaga stomatis]|uniref:DUF3127 domain-containing protein n=1 Tax=Capnocytophaga stomatis TaxID=1848904 RepID=A0A250FXP9_9FLAO|nr:DUF3127 domain-containing protein [Capnocytophaga stomatis]ATA89890.1 hypothetical protein CGC58_09225 [Capnocytophaga stomatis]GIJ93767.1 hypothetical protein CAPN002_09850 [Capnocytophaga stomatis]GIJ95996.1 hypothetical protein CAPN001_05650 [Capnocytophaga stomatis]GIM49790.1 hypothetical protein CAPN003_12420 [Capnocytophaga stomatis]
MELQGRIKLISNTQTFGTNGFQKREVVITTEEQYPQHVIFEFTQEKCALLDAFRVGQLVKISFNVRGREWINPQGEAKYFNSLQGWRIENMEMAQQAYQQQQYQQPYPNQQYQQPYQQQTYGGNPSFPNQVTPPPMPPQGGFETTHTNTEDFDDLPF